MTHNDLVAKLRTMLDAATHRVDVTATVLLFGVLFNEEIGSTRSVQARSHRPGARPFRSRYGRRRIGF